MQRGARLGCLTPLGIIAAIVMVGFVVMTAFAQGGVLFSPGELNAQPGDLIGGVRSHADIGGECSACHAAPWSSETMADRCMACHTEIAAESQNPDTLHGTIAQDDPTLFCAACHTEHNGPTAALTLSGPDNFPHERVGFSLNSHQTGFDGQPFACDDCHTQGVATFSLQTCDTCHRQQDTAFMVAHTQEFGSDCLACHDGVDRFGKTFSHAAFTFPLEGKHIDVQCAACHENVRSLDGFKSAPMDCYSCHKQDDAHNGRFGTQCETCHSPAGWKPATFDHNLAAFKLEGKHTEVACEACHVNGVFQGTPMDCFSCHKQDDAHNGRFGTQCETCHSPAGWKPATFDHNLAAFKLEGKHTEVACEACHVNGVFQGTPMDCFSCHKQDDAHNGRFGTQCETCHTPAGWKPANFDHNLAAFKLEGAHANVACEACHIGGRFQGTPMDCFSCHKQDDAHNGRFGTQCEACHSPTRWEDATFDHSRSNFPLTGAHVNVRCESCHGNNRFAGTPTACVACHGEPAWHAGALGTNCASCHSTSSWRPASFNLSHPEPRVKEHGTGINHGGASCQTCHPSTVRSYTCLACHSDNQGGEGKDGKDDD